MRCIRTDCTEDDSESDGEEDDDEEDEDEDEDIEDEDSESMEAMEIGISPIQIPATSDQQVPSTLINRQMLEDYSGDENSMSSRMSNKSDKNMADFDGEDSGCDEELLQLAAHTNTNLSTQQLNQMAFHSNFQTSKNVHPSTQNITTTISNQFNIENVCKPGSTLLWDLLQDDDIVSSKNIFKSILKLKKKIIGIVSSTVDHKEIFIIVLVFITILFITVPALEEDKWDVCPVPRAYF